MLPIPSKNNSLTLRRHISAERGLTQYGVYCTLSSRRATVSHFVHLPERKTSKTLKLHLANMQRTLRVSLLGRLPRPLFITRHY